MAEAKFTPSSDKTALYEWVLHSISEEQDRLHAMASSLAQRLEPADPAHPGDDAPLVEWRLAQLLQERLESTDFMECIRAVLLPDTSGRLYLAAAHSKGA
jgi:hypothetical protein